MWGKVENLDKILEVELRKKRLRDNTIRCYKSAFNNFFKRIDYDNKDLIINNLTKVKNKTELSQIINSIRTLKNSTSYFKFIDEDILKDIIKNKCENKHKSYEPYLLSDKLKRINKIRDEKYRLAFRLMLVSGLRVFEVENLKKDDIEINDNEIIVTVIDGKGGKYGEVKCLEDKYLSKKLKEFLKDKTSDEKLFYTKIAMQKKAQELEFKCHDLRRAYSKLVKKNLLNELVEINEDEKEKIIEEEVKIALRHSRFETSKKYLYSKRIKV